MRGRDDVEVELAVYTKELGPLETDPPTYLLPQKKGNFCFALVV